VRNRKQITASRPGETLAAGARLAFEALGEATARIADEDVVPSGRVVLGCHESLAAYALPAFMAGFLARHPRVELKLWNGNSIEVERELTEGRIDLGLIVNPSRHPDTVIAPLFDDSVELFHCLDPRRGARAEALLAGHPLIYVPDLVQSQDLLRRLHARQLVARTLPCSSLELVKSLVLDRVGVGLLPRRVATHRTGKQLRSLSPPMPRYLDRVALVRRFDLPRTAAIRLVSDELAAHGKAMPPA
jgi:DNA-binding transcriptional LysR family regulator